MPEPAAPASVAESTQVLSAEDVAKFHHDGRHWRCAACQTLSKHGNADTCDLASGYIVLENFASPGECAALIDRANSLVEGFNPEKFSVFSTTNQVPTNYCHMPHISIEVDDARLHDHSIELSWLLRSLHANIERQSPLLQASVSDDYFFESANNISFFFEEGAHDEEGNLLQEKALSINKIGHALHDLDPVFRKFTRSSKLTELLLELGLVKPLPVQSMYIFKV